MAALRQVVEVVLEVEEVAHLVGDVEEPAALVALHQVDRVVIGVAAQEGEEVADRVGPAEPEHVEVEALDLEQVRYVGGDVSELGGPQAEGIGDAAGLLALEQRQRRPAARLGERQCGRDARLGVAAALARHAGRAQSLAGLVEGAVDLEPEPGAAVGLAGAHDDAVVVGAGRQVGGVAGALDEREAERVLVVVDEPGHVAGGELVDRELRDGHRRRAGRRLIELAHRFPRCRP